MQGKWRKSSYSGGGSDQCVECRAMVGNVSVRDSKNPAGGMLQVGATAWTAFTNHLKRA